MLSVRIAFALAAVFAVAALWLAFRPVATMKEPAAQSVPVAMPQPAKAFDLVVKDGKLVSGPAALHVRVGEQVTLRIQSNAKDELHVHGYDLKLPIKAGDTATLQFMATRSGRFELELHRKHTPLGALEVYPQ